MKKTEKIRKIRNKNNKKKQNIRKNEKIEKIEIGCFRGVLGGGLKFMLGPCWGLW